MTNIDAIKQEIKESLERKLLQAYAEGDETFEQFVSNLSEEQKDLLPGLNSLLEAGVPALVGKGPAPVIPAAPRPSGTSAINKNPLRGTGNFAGFGGFPNSRPVSKISSTNATGSQIQGHTGSPSGPAQPSTKPIQASPISPVTPNAPVNTASTSGKTFQQGSQAKPRTAAPVSKPTMRSGPTIGPERTASNETGVEKFGQPKLQASIQARTNPVAKETQATPATKPSGAVKPIQKQPIKPIQNRPKPAKTPMRPIKKTSKSSFRNTNTDSIGSHMSRSMGGLGEDTHLKESFESFLRNKFLKGE